jgi:hypothetical protein
MTDDKSKLVKEREKLVAMGMLRDSGRRRNGQIVWEITELGKAYAENTFNADKAKN